MAALTALGVGVGASVFLERAGPSGGVIEGDDLHALHISTDGRVVVGQHGGLRFSSDLGRTWSAPSGQGDAMAVAASPERPEVVYQAGHDLLLKSVDGGRTWARPRFGVGLGSDIHGFAVSAEDWIYANVAGQGLVRSTDDGRTWEPVSADTAMGMALAAGPGSPPTLYANTVDRGLIRSADGGATWAPTAQVPSMAPTGLSVHPGSGNVYVANVGGVWSSRDGGASWAALGPDVPMALVATDPKDEDRLVAVSQLGEVYRSDDGGATWER